MMTTTLTHKHQVTLPPEIVQALSLTPGMQLDWTLGPDGTLIGTPQPSRARRAAALYGAGRKYLRPGADPVRKMINAANSTPGITLLEPPLQEYNAVGGAL
jgi:bifunctional DNA-binding transcriptional regulator/antitoxin component of YhaV-PrlF toxin-antitoxin module